MDGRNRMRQVRNQDMGRWSLVEHIPIITKSPDLHTTHSYSHKRLFCPPTNPPRPVPTRMSVSTPASKTSKPQAYISLPNSPTPIVQTKPKRKKNAPSQKRLTSPRVMILSFPLSVFALHQRLNHARPPTQPNPTLPTI